MLDNTKTIIEIIIGMATGVTAIVAFLNKKIVKPLKLVKDSIQENLAENNSMLRQHSEILKELKFNGGKSIKDVVNAIDTKLDKTNSTLDKTQRDLNNIIAIVKAQQEYDSDGIFIADKHGNCYYFNKAYLDITGLSSNEAMNFGWTNAIHPKDYERILTSWKTCISTMSNMELVHSYKNIKSKRVIKAKVSWQVQVQPNEDSEQTILIFGRVKLIDK